jgi:tetratricopeptide (TPR) repeat protein
MRLITFFVAASSLFGQSPSAFETHLAAGQAAVQQSRYAEAETQFRAAVAEIARPDANRPPQREADAYAALCDLDLLMSRFDEAIALAGKAIDTLEASGRQQDLTPYLSRLAAGYRVSGKTAMALPVLQRILTFDQAMSGDDPKVSVDYDKLGSAYLELFQMDDARAAYQKALDTRISRQGPDTVEVATSWVNLGVVEERNAKPEPARKDWETALAISEAKLGPDAYGLTGILDRLGRLFSEQKQYPEAEGVFQRSLAIREKLLGSRHSDIAPALENLAWVFFFDSKFIDAEPVFRRALEIWTATKEPTSPMIAQAMDNLGTLYSAQKRYAEAEPFFKKALAIRETKDIESLSNLALLYEATKDLKRSDDYFQRAILVSEKGLGGDHPGTEDILDEYASMLRNAGRILDAKKVEAHSKELKDKLPPKKPGEGATVTAQAPIQKH